MFTSKFYPCTNHRSSRIKVSNSTTSKFYPWNHDLNSFENHVSAVRRFIEECTEANPKQKFVVHDTDDRRGFHFTNENYVTKVSLFVERLAS